jgi:tetrahydromethanopterin S-methyltransferase subunit B
MSQSQLSQDFDDAWTTIAPEIPDTLSLDSSEIGSEQPDLKQSLDDAHNSIDKNLADAHDGLAQAREWIVYYQEGFWGLVGLTAFIVLCIILVNRDVKAICRILGSVLVPYGIVEAAGIIVARVLAHSQMAKISAMPQSLQPWLVGLIEGLMNPLLIFAISCAALGVILFIVSFIYGRNQEKPATV